MLLQKHKQSKPFFHSGLDQHSNPDELLVHLTLVDQQLHQMAGECPERQVPLPFQVRRLTLSGTAVHLAEGGALNYAARPQRPSSPPCSSKNPEHTGEESALYSCLPSPGC